MRETALLGDHPGALLPGWSVTNMLGMATAQYCYPIMLLISVETDDMLCFQKPFEARLS
jgi:hypothetical protein